MTVCDHGMDDATRWVELSISETAWIFHTQKSLEFTQNGTRKQQKSCEQRVCKLKRFVEKRDQRRMLCADRKSIQQNASQNIDQTWRWIRHNSRSPSGSTPVSKEQELFCKE